jgi:hypothetical protein
VIGRRDFIFTIGYDGSTAVVDGALRRRYGSLGTLELAEQGLFKQAVSAAIYELSTAPAAGLMPAVPTVAGPLAQVLERYNARAAQKLGSVEELKRVFGVHEVPAGITRTRVIG